MLPLCWLLRSSLQEPETRAGTVFRRSSCFDEERHGARISRTGPSLFAEYGEPLLATKQREDAFSSVVERKQGREDRKHVSPLREPPEDAGPLSLTTHESVFSGFCCSLGVIVSSTSHRNRKHLARLAWRRCRKFWWVWKPLPKPLVRSGLMEGPNRGIEETRAWFFLENEEGIEAFAPHTPEKAFTDRIRLGSSRRSAKHVDASF